MSDERRTDEPEHGQLAQIIDELGNTHLAIGHNGNGLNEFGWETDSGWFDFHQIKNWVALSTPEEIRLRDLLRWRDSSKELPTEHGEYLVHYLQSKGDGYARMVVHWNGSWPLWFPNRKSCYWRPIGPLPGEGGEA